MLLSAVISLSGYRARRICSISEPAQPATRSPGTSGRSPSILEHKYWVDEIYQGLIVEPLRFLGRVLFGIDKYGVDGAVNAAGVSPTIPGWILKLTVQRGYLQGYAAAMLLGIVVILCSCSCK